MTTTFLSFWGKGGDARLDQPQWHPVAYHGLDVAAVADCLLRQNERKLGRIADLLGLSPEGTQPSQILYSLKPQIVSKHLKTDTCSHLALVRAPPKE